MWITVSVDKTGTGIAIVASQDQAIRINNLMFIGPCIIVTVEE